MEKIALITDSACDIDEETISKYNIRVLPFKIIYKDKEYTDKVDITPKEIYDKMKVEIPKSSQPSMEDLENVYKELEEQHFTHVIAIVISSGLSGTFNAFKIVSGRFPEIKTFIFDTKSTSVCEGILLKKCGALIQEGVRFDHIIQSIPDMKRKLHFFFVFGSLEYARKGGRIGRISGTIGELLDVKPIVSFDEELGQCFTYGKIRGRAKSLKRLVELGEEIAKDKQCDAYIVHGNVEEDAKGVYEMLRKNPRIRNVHLIGQISAVVGVYSGPGTVGVCYAE